VPFFSRLDFKKQGAILEASCQENPEKPDGQLVDPGSDVDARLSALSRRRQGHFIDTRRLARRLADSGSCFGRRTV
jgi:hypothetical protein